MGEEDLPANPVKHYVIQTPVMGGRRVRGVGVEQEGKRMGGGEARVEREPVCCRDSGGEVERMTKQGEVDGLQIPQSRLGGQEVIHTVGRACQLLVSALTESGQSHERGTVRTHSLGQ